MSCAVVPINGLSKVLKAQCSCLFTSVLLAVRKMQVLLLLCLAVGLALAQDDEIERAVKLEGRRRPPARHPRRQPGRGLDTDPELEHELERELEHDLEGFSIRPPGAMHPEADDEEWSEIGFEGSGSDSEVTDERGAMQRWWEWLWGKERSEGGARRGRRRGGRGPPVLYRTVTATATVTVTITASANVPSEGGAESPTRQQGPGREQAIEETNRRALANFHDWFSDADVEEGSEAPSGPGVSIDNPID